MDNEHEEKVPEVKVEDVGIRNDLVSTAVKFLENSKVHSTSQEVKRTFLKKKGLTDEEINQAFSLVKPQQNQIVPSPQLQVQQNHSQFSPSPVLQVPQKTSQFGSSLRDFLNILLLIGGASYGLRYIWKTYIRPWLYGYSKSSPTNQVEELCKTVVASVDRIHTALLSLTEKFDSHITKIDQVLVAQKELARPDGILEIRQEIQSVKGLLLSSRSFPTNPTISPPSIPAWQLEENKDDITNLDLVSNTRKNIETAMIDTENMENSETEMIDSDRDRKDNNSSHSEIEIVETDSNEEQ